MKLGKLLEVDIRKIWAHEQYDFSKWLASEANIQELGDIAMQMIALICREKIGISLKSLGISRNIHLFGIVVGYGMLLEQWRICRIFMALRRRLAVRWKSVGCFGRENAMSGLLS